MMEAQLLYGLGAGIAAFLLFRKLRSKIPKTRSADILEDVLSSPEYKVKGRFD